MGPKSSYGCTYKKSYRDTQTTGRDGGHVRMEAETGVMQSGARNAKYCPQSPAVTRHGRVLPLILLREHGPAGT